MKARVLIGAHKYAVYLKRKVLEKTMDFFSFPARFFATKNSNLKDYKIYGRTVQSNLPDGCVQLEYIESTTNQYINTGIKGELESELTFIGQRTGDNPNQNYGHLWGDLSVSARAISFNTPKSASVSGSSRFGDKATSSSTSPVKVIPLNKPVTIIQNKEKATASTGFEITFGTTTEFETDNPLFLFTSALSGGGPTASSHKWRCEYFSHTKNGVLVQEFIPCKNAQGEIGMYDTVSGNFFKSETSTSFVAGPEVQPTPTEPIAIESVGDKTKNLFDKETIIKGAYINANGQRTANANFGYGDYVKVEPGKTYTISGKSGSSGSSYRRVHGYDSSKTWTEQILAQQISGGADYTFTFTTLENCEYIRFSGVSATNDYAEINGVQIEEGSVATEYEPRGYKIPVNIANKNMLNPNVEVYNGYIGLMNVGEAIRYGSSTASKTYKKFAYFKPGTYTYSYNGSTSTGSLRFVLCDENEIVREIVSTPVVQGRNEVTVTFTKEGWGYVSALVVATDIQIEAGDTATSYEPYFNETTNIYLSEPLRKLGDLTDYIDFENQKVVRQVGAEKLGTTNWTYESNYTRFSRDFSSLKSAGTRMTHMLTDGFTAFSAGTGITTVPNNAVYTGATTSKALYFKTDVYTTVSAFTDALSETYIYFPITQTEESITLPAIALQQGNLSMDTETKIKPSQLTITGDIDDVR